VTAAICVLVLIAWMAAGQIFLGRHGWTQYQRQRRAV
jgi:DNA-binding transcriptional regulator of glucitol operon